MNLYKLDNKEKSIEETLKIGIFQSEPLIDGKLIYINEFASKILGYDSPDNIIGRRFSSVFANENSYRYMINSFLNCDDLNDEVEISLKLKDGLNCDAGVTGTLVKCNNGSNLRIDGTIRVIHKNLDEELEKSVIANVNKILIANLYMKEVYQRICEELHKVIKWERVSILLKENVKDGLVGGVVDFAVMNKGLKKGKVDEKFQQLKSHSMVGSILEKVVITKKPVIVADTSKDSLDTSKYFAEDGLMSRLAYPLIIKDKITGCVAFSSKTLNYFDEKHLSLLEHVVPLLSLAIENSRIHYKATKTEKEYNDLFKTIDNPWG